MLSLMESLSCISTVLCASVQSHAPKLLLSAFLEEPQMGDLIMRILNLSPSATLLSSHNFKNFNRFVMQEAMDSSGVLEEVKPKIVARTNGSCYWNQGLK